VKAAHRLGERVDGLDQVAGGPGGQA
jgi:hypothetical protein